MKRNKKSPPDKDRPSLQIDYILIGWIIQGGYKLNIKIFKNYIEKCNSNNVIPTLKGAAIYKRFGVVR